MTKTTLGKVTGIFLASNMGEAMQPRDHTLAIAGEGLVGDRYALGTGAYSNSKKQKIRHVSLIGQEAIDRANNKLVVPFSVDETRRNLVTHGVELNDLVDEEFTVGDVAMRGVELCDPCKRPEKLAGKDGFMQAFQELGGLRAEVLQSGFIVVGSPITQQAA
ncbi:MAG: domain containing protein [Candidatus Saccharibacteria bacterium]|nr:domain containing protein [Candidatus Saccharibacteria bacterium]